MKNPGIPARIGAALLCLSMTLAAAAAPDVNNARRILFVGNSYTYINNLPAMFAAIAARENSPVPAVDMLVAGGITLEQILGQETAEDVFERGKYDTVVLQEKGGLLICVTSAQKPRPPECGAAINAHRQFAKIARRHGVRDVLVFGTWSMSEGKQGSVSRGTRQVASAAKAKAVDVGAMVETARKNAATPALFLPDMHLTEAGTFLAAAALYEAVYEKRVSPGEFRAEIPMYPGMTNFSPRRVASLQRRLPPPQPVEVSFSAAEVAALLAALHR